MNRTQPTDDVLKALFQPAAHPAATQQDKKGAGGLLLMVLFTTVPATLRALRRGAQLANQLGVRIRILVPHVVPYPLPLDRPQVDPEFRVRRFRTLSVDGAIETRIDVLLCRDAREAIAQTLCPGSVLLIGTRNRWWPSKEQRLAKWLGKLGHEVIVVPEDCAVGRRSARRKFTPPTTLPRIVSPFRSSKHVGSSGADLTSS